MKITFLGKNIKLVNYDLTRATSYKFEVRENAELVPNGTHQLSTALVSIIKLKMELYSLLIKVQQQMLPMLNMIFTMELQTLPC